MFEYFFLDQGVESESFTYIPRNYRCQLNHLIGVYPVDEAGSVSFTALSENKVSRRVNRCETKSHSLTSTPAFIDDEDALKMAYLMLNKTAENPRAILSYCE